MRFRTALLALGLGSVPVALNVLLAAPAPSVSLSFYFGNLHSHTSFSDGSGTPRQAYEHARDVANIDFLAITEHNHRRAEDLASPDRTDGKLIGKDHSLYDQLIADANAANRDGEFVALYGQEFSSISKGNHVNVFMADKVITTQNGNYKRVFTQQWMNEHSASLIQFNHPWDGSIGNRDIRVDDIGMPHDTNYGFDRFGSRLPFMKAVDGKVSLIEVTNGPAMERVPSSSNKPFSNVEYYRAYLNLGLHLAPTADQDNHYLTWGNVTDARTVVLAPTLSRPAILSALKQRRAYASEDKDLKIAFTVDGGLMGSQLEALPVGQSAQIQVKLSDEDDPNSTYRVELFYDNATGGPKALPARTATVGNPGTATFSHKPEEGKGYYYAQITNRSGPRKGRRAWTAPIWLE